MEKRVRFQVRLPTDIYTMLKKMATKEARSINGQVIALIRERHVEQAGAAATAKYKNPTEL